MVIFDARNFQPPWGLFFILIIIIGIIFAALYYEYLIKDRKKNMFQRILINIGLLSLLIISTVLSYKFIIGINSDLKDLLTENKCQKIDGKLENLTRGLNGKPENESFIVNNILFLYAPNANGRGFNQLLTENNLAKNGDHVRLCYIKTDWNNSILYFYVFRTP